LVLPALAEAPAVIVTLCAVPGVRFKEAGFAVTPAGRPVIATFTVPVKPFTAVALTLIVEPAVPAVRLRVEGETAMVKSGDGAVDDETLAAIVTVWFRVPEVPEKVRVALPEAVEAPTVMVTDWATPGVRVRAAG
jgi:hypothetical protein